MKTVMWRRAYRLGGLRQQASQILVNSYRPWPPARQRGFTAMEFMVTLLRLDEHMRVREPGPFCKLGLSGLLWSGLVWPRWLSKPESPLTMRVLSMLMTTRLAPGVQGVLVLSFSCQSRSILWRDSGSIDRAAWDGVWSEGRGASIFWPDIQRNSHPENPMLLAQ